MLALMKLPFRINLASLWNDTIKLLVLSPCVAERGSKKPMLQFEKHDQGK